MSEFPPGEWSLVLVGDQWPDDSDLMALSHGEFNRGQIKNAYTNFAAVLRNAQTGALGGQQGHTADDLRDAFRQGEDQARRVADKNGIKQRAYSTAYDSTLGLQQDLTSLAQEGNNQIKEIQSSKQPVEAKVTQIVALIHQCRALASLAAAKYGGNVLDAMQQILDEEGTGAVCSPVRTCPRHRCRADVPTTKRSNRPRERCARHSRPQRLHFRNPQQCRHITSEIRDIARRRRTAESNP